MEQLVKTVKRELENIGDKGLTSSNLDTTYKLSTIYKNMSKGCYYDNMSNCDNSYGRNYRDSDDRYGRRGGNRGYNDSYGHYPLDERTERHFERMREGIYNYNEGKNRYRDGDSKDRMLDGVEMAMGALVNFVEFMMDNVETSQEKETIRKYIDKLKKV